MPLAQPDGRDWPRGTMTRPAQELRREGVLPDIAGLYGDSRPEISALILSHSHLDHYGLAHHAHPDIPVYASPGTIAMLRVSKLFIPDALIPENLRTLPTEEIHVGSFR
ncbi:MAG: MBL fold metallo-hydrolase, partial [Kiritimatiellia bacterium]|nr:MBL fold metallo-hydrolase [Kiritimatiellia bacterium]